MTNPIIAGLIARAAGLEDEEEQCLKGLIKKWAKALKQEAIYYQPMDWHGEFIRPD